ncbi:MAG TPA: CcdB family protein [Rubrivivax sp.]|nr:CcdB family protein [Rubrivivax sp.]
MARFDVYANPDSSERRYTPYFVDVQNDFIDGLATRVVIPLRKEAAFALPARDLNPMISVLGTSLVLDTAALGAVPVTELRKAVLNLREERELIHDAIDALFGGY